MKGYVRASHATVQLPRELDEAAGRKVVDSEGHSIGHVSDVVFDEFHTDRAYLEIESDHHFEINHRHFLAPVQALDLNADPISVALSAPEIQDLPGHDRSMPFSEEYEVALLGFWGTQMSHNVEAVRDPLVERPGETHSMRVEHFDSDPETPHSGFRSSRRN